MSNRVNPTRTGGVFSTFFKGNYFSLSAPSKTWAVKQKINIQINKDKLQFYSRPGFITRSDYSLAQLPEVGHIFNNVQKYILKVLV